jgi:hypothetical protein
MSLLIHYGKKLRWLDTIVFEENLELRQSFVDRALNCIQNAFAILADRNRSKVLVIGNKDIY